MRLRRVDPSSPGITRRGRGRGFEYFSPDGAKLTDPDVLERIRALAIPPAYRDVWISPDPRGHLQALGTDDAGRRQYRYHPEWRRRQDLVKFDRVLDFARDLPRLRAVCRDAVRATDRPTRPRVLAAAVLLLDAGFFRVGGEQYARDNATFGLATIRRDHVVVRTDGVIAFDYTAKGGKRRVVELVDPDVAAVLTTMKRRRGGDELLAHRGDTGRDDWADVRSGDVNDHLKDLTGLEGTSAKDFRTWNGTVKAAVTLADAWPAATSATARTRAKALAAREVADLLGNTPTVARSSYVDPRVFDRFDSGWTIAPALERLGEGVPYGAPAFHGPVEEAVIDLLEERTDAGTVEHVDAAAAALGAA